MSLLGEYAPAAVWALLYVSDFAFTLWGAALYRRLGGRFIQFEHYELTPMWKETVAASRWLSPRFALALLISTAGVALVCALGAADLQVRPAAELGIGALLLLEGAIHVRHIRNIAMFRALARPESGVSGSIRYPAAFSYAASATELLAFAALYLGIAVVEGSFFCLGGALGTAVLSVKHRSLGKRALRTSPPQTPRETSLSAPASPP